MGNNYSKENKGGLKDLVRSFFGKLKIRIPKVPSGHVMVNNVLYDGSVLIVADDKIFIDGEHIADAKAGEKDIVIQQASGVDILIAGNLSVTGDVGDIDAVGNVSVTGDAGELDVTGPVTVGGGADDVDAVGPVTINGNIMGDVDATGHVTVTGSISGDVDASGDVRAQKISGDVDAGGNVVMGK